MKISAVYKITNTVTNDFYIGSSKDVKQRWASHKWPSKWKRYSNNPMYIDMQRYGVDKFEFEILEEVEEGKLKEKEQQFIETLKPTYNDRNANGFDFERRKKYQKSDKGKEAQKKYNKSDKRKEAQKKYQKSDKGKEAQKKYESQLCCYNGETLTLTTLSKRFSKAGIDHPIQEAKKYLLKKESDNAIEFYDVYP